MQTLTQGRTLGASAILVALLTLSGCATSYHIPNATFLGERTVDHRSDRDQIRVGKRDGAFRAIQLLVRRNDVNVRSIRIQFENGSTQTIDFRRPLRVGSETRPIDLSGGRRIIEKVVFNYDTRGNRGARGVVALYGIR